jgi:hypothetical protein
LSFRSGECDQKPLKRVESGHEMNDKKSGVEKNFHPEKQL